MTPDPIDPTAKTLDQLVAELVEQGNGTAKGVEQLTRSVDANTRRRRSNNIAAFVVVALLAVFAVYNQSGVRELQDQICPLVVMFGTSGTDAPPSTERAREIADRADALAERWDCTR